MVRHHLRPRLLTIALLLVATACGSDHEPTEVDVAAADETPIPVAELPGAEVASNDYGGFTGDLAVVLPAAADDARRLVGVHFPEVVAGPNPMASA